MWGTGTGDCFSKGAVFSFDTFTLGADTCSSMGCWCMLSNLGGVFHPRSCYKLCMWCCRFLVYYLFLDCMAFREYSSRRSRVLNVSFPNLQNVEASVVFWRAWVSYTATLIAISIDGVLSMGRSCGKNSTVSATLTSRFSYIYLVSPVVLRYRTNVPSIDAMCSPWLSCSLLLMYDYFHTYWCYGCLVVIKISNQLLVGDEI